MPNTQPPIDASQPTIQGFDMPSAAGDAAVDQVMIAMLDMVPDRRWMGAFVEQSAAFRDAHAVVDMRVNQQNLVVMAPLAALRGVARELRAFVHRVGRRSMEWRITGAPFEGDARPAGETDPAILADLQRVADLPGVPALLEAVTRQTGMRFAAVARVTDNRWIACAVYDALEFGLLPGQDLVLETTICNEIRQHRQTIAFDRASGHPIFATHPTPAMYGFESYISVPIYRPDGEFFGTLCAIDPEPARLDAATVQAVEMFARAIGAELEQGPIAA